MTLLEFCCDTLHHIPLALERGVGRIELCDRLDVGGLSPPVEMVEEAVKYCHPLSVPIVAMVRPHADGFVYSSRDVEVMLDTIDCFKRVGVDGVVFGALTTEGDLDRPTLLVLLRAAQGLSVTFHMAFDLIPSSLQLCALDWLATEGVGRVLVHGGPLSIPIKHFYSSLHALAAAGMSRIIVMPGGGVTYHNVSEVVSHVGTSEAHGTKIVDLS